MAQLSKRSRRRQNIHADKKEFSKRKPPECPTGKRRFPSEIAAHQEMKRLQKVGNFAPGKTPKRTYPCWSCKGWHTTSKPKREG